MIKFKKQKKVLKVQIINPKMIKTYRRMMKS